MAAKNFPVFQFYAIFLGVYYMIFKVILFEFQLVTNFSEVLRFNDIQGGLTI